METKIKVSEIKQFNIIVIKQEGGNDFFITSKNGIIISKSSLAFILKFLVQNGILSKKILEGILAEVSE